MSESEILATLIVSALNELKATKEIWSKRDAGTGKHYINLLRAIEALEKIK